MRQKKWLLVVRNGDGGRGYATEYRINPQWIINPDILSPFSVSSQKRVTPEVRKGDNGGSKRVTPVSPQPSRTIIEPTTTQNRDDEQIVVDPDDLIWPHFMLGADVHTSALQILQECPEGERQNVLHEIAGLADRGGVRSPLGLLHKLVDRAKHGQFTPAAALEYQRKLEDEAKIAQSRIEEKRQPSDTRSPRVKEAAREHLSELRRRLNA
jgi:hypothetical protein